MFGLAGGRLGSAVRGHGSSPGPYGSESKVASHVPLARQVAAS